MSIVRRAICVRCGRDRDVSTEEDRTNQGAGKLTEITICPECLKRVAEQSAPEG